MKQKLISKIAALLTGLGLTAISAYPATGATFTFSKKGFTGEPFVDGTFSGVDSNNDNRLQVDELSNFETTLPLDSVPFFLDSVPFSTDDLMAFDYVLGTTHSLSFYAQKRVDINNNSYNLYDLAANRSISLAVTHYVNDFPDRTLILDGASEPPVLVSQVRSVPEPSSIKSLIFLLLFGLGIKQIYAKKRSKVALSCFNNIDM